MNFRPTLILPPGALRLVLAGLVVWSHFASLAKSPLYTPLEGIAVCGFFFLSGYWVANLWENRYARCRAPLLTFYTSRLLRIYPQVTVATLLMFALVGGSWQHLLWNLFLFGVQFGGAINPPAWSLAVELQFYALAPLLFIVLRSRIASAVILIGGMVFFVRFSLGLTGTYVYHFIVPFALGVIYAHAPRHALAVKFAPWSLLAILVFAVATNLEAARPFIPLDYASNDVRRLTVMFFHIISLPFIAASLSIRSGAVDRALGDLAYPVYLLHWPMFVLAGRLASTGIVPLAVLLTTASSFAMFWFVDRPLEVWRHRFVARRIDLAANFVSSSVHSQPSADGAMRVT
ncbi:MAG: acyltransferase [Pseudomonadota bacterium]